MTVGPAGEFMIPAENIRDWRGQDVVDVSGSKVGALEAVYFDTATDQPAFLSVKIGMVGRHRLVFVPLGGAVVSPNSVKVTADKKLITGVNVFDVFEGAALGSDKKSIAIEVAIQPTERTLTDEDFEALARRIVDNVGKQTGGVLRG